MPNDTFKEFLQKNLSWFDFETLNHHLGETPKAITLLLNDPSRGKKLQLEKIADLLQHWNPEYDAEYLRSNYAFGVGEQEEVNP
ncbi:MAG: hypothetical protein ACEQSL_03775 [Sediminibacterium sp.]